MAARGLAVVLLTALVMHRGEAVQVVQVAEAAPLQLQIVHLNDFHARFEPVSLTAGACKEGAKCIGGLARVAAAVAAELSRNPKALVLNGGDNFQGTLWYSLFKGNATAHFMTQLPWDAYTIGNHEFDHGIDGLTPFLEEAGKKAPFVIANMDDSDEPRMHGLWVPSTVVEQDGHQIGIVGYIWKDTWTIARTEKLKFGDELEALDREAGRLKQKGVDVIVALSHAGLDVDLAVAKQTKYADVIVGAHSHSLLYNGQPPNGDKAAGPYPEVVKQDSGRTVLVVQAAAYTKYLGNLSVSFDEQGEVASWSGQPIYMDTDLPEDEQMLQDMKPWKAQVEAQGHVVLGESIVELDKQTHDCYSGECSLGNFVADAMVSHYVGKGPEGTWTAAAIAFINAGGLRTNIEPGDITYSDMVAAQPFENTVDLVELQGKDLKQFLEDNMDPNLTLIHWSGLRVKFDASKPFGQRVVFSEVLCAACSIPVYEPIQDDQWYSIAAPSFVVEGGDNFVSFSNNLRNRIIGPVDMEVFEAYLQTHRPVMTEMDGRLVVLNGERLQRRQLARRQRREPLIFY